MLQAINRNGITDVGITVERAPQTTTVTITDTVLQVLPWVDIPIHVQARAPTEPDDG